MAVSRARWRCRPAAKIPSARAIGSWISHDGDDEHPGALERGERRRVVDELLPVRQAGELDRRGAVPASRS